MTDRQASILATIIEEFAEVAAPVGSVTLAKLFNVSSATIRAEMVALEKMGFLQQPHTSAGRVPTDKGYRWYVNRLQEAPPRHSRSQRDTRAIELSLRSSAEPAHIIRQTVDTLVQLTDNAGLATIGGQLYISGLAHLFAQPEFSEGNAVTDVAYLLDNLDPWLRETAPNQPVSVFIGQENPIGKSSGCSLIISKYRSSYSDDSYIGVIGPTRQNYRDTMSLVRYAGQQLEKELV